MPRTAGARDRPSSSARHRCGQRGDVIARGGGAVGLASSTQACALGHDLERIDWTTDGASAVLLMYFGNDRLPLMRDAVMRRPDNIKSM
jgi:hypothetical protein